MSGKAAVGALVGGLGGATIAVLGRALFARQRQLEAFDAVTSVGILVGATIGASVGDSLGAAPASTSTALAPTMPAPSSAPASLAPTTPGA